MTQSVDTDLQRVLPLPYLPTYIARRPASLRKNCEETIPDCTPIFSVNWQKASDNYATQHQSFYDTPFIVADLDSPLIEPKEYDTYKQYYYEPVAPNAAEALNRVRPFMVPNHTTQTSLKWSRFLDEYPDRLKIDYPLPDADNDLYNPPRPGRYPYLTKTEMPSFYAGLNSGIQPVTNPFRQSESRQQYTVTHPIWIPYGTPPRR